MKCWPQKKENVFANIDFSIKCKLITENWRDVLCDNMIITTVEIFRKIYITVQLIKTKQYFNIW